MKNAILILLLGAFLGLFCRFVVDYKAIQDCHNNGTYKTVFYNIKLTCSVNSEK